ncbi:MAG TPA: (2Fe-2S) ferredoxin domain-containing protein [Deinococcales bacterium]|nr:(2Fe-2S) ferredoxin domain-containing protein [Deinococcales bacterium]
MRPEFFPTRAHLLVCTDPSCRDRGADLLYRALWQGLERERLAYYQRGGNLRLTEAGCLGACRFGPNITCYYRKGGELREAWYHGMDYPAAMALARALHAGEEPPAERRFDAAAANE